jgi:hypothetical protein
MCGCANTRVGIGIWSCWDAGYITQGRMRGRQLRMLCGPAVCSLLHEPVREAKHVAISRENWRQLKACSSPDCTISRRPPAPRSPGRLTHAIRAQQRFPDKCGLIGGRDWTRGRRVRDVPRLRLDHDMALRCSGKVVALRCSDDVMKRATAVPSCCEPKWCCLALRSFQVPR